MLGLPHGSLHLAEHDPAWSAAFAAEAARIRTALGELAGTVEHIGSTAVPGLLAKPILDIGVTVSSPENAQACVAPLEALGYAYRGQHGDDPSRRYFVLGRDGRRLIQLHLWIVPAEGWDRLIAFRDLMRSRPDLAEAYAWEKIRVAAETGPDKHAYSEGKGPFIEAVLRGDDPATSSPPGAAPPASESS